MENEAPVDRDNLVADIVALETNEGAEHLALRRAPAFEDGEPEVADIAERVLVARDKQRAMNRGPPRTTISALVAKEAPVDSERPVESRIKKALCAAGVGTFTMGKYATQAAITAEISRLMTSH